MLICSNLANAHYYYFLFVLLVVVNLLNSRISRVLLFCLFVIFFFTVLPLFFLPPCYCKVYCNVMSNDVK